MKSHVAKFLLIIVFGLWGPRLASAQPPAAEEPAYEPPAMTFPEGRIGLAEAVRLALAHNPNIHLQRESSRFQLGLLQESRGLFDGTLLGDLTYEYGRQELRESTKRAERERREAFQEVADRTGPIADRAESILREIENLQRDPTGARVSDPDLQAQIDAINVLIAQSTNPATRAQLTQLRDDTIERGRQAFSDIATQFRGQNTEALESLRNLGEVPEDEESTFALFNLSYRQLQRNGIAWGPFLESSYDSTNYVGKDKDSDFGGKGIEDVYRVDVGFFVDLPLGRGRGLVETAAFESSAAIDYEASLAALRHEASATVLDTVLAYWDLVAAQQRVEVLSRSVELQSNLVGISRSLVEGDEIPAAELPRVLASEAAARGRLDEARRLLHEARSRLARVIGLAVESEANTPLAQDGFPSLAGNPLEGYQPDQLTRQAVVARQDLQAALSLQESGKVLLEAARLALRSRIDLQLEASATALGETAFSEAVDRWVGPSGRLALFYEKPIGNNFARGRLAQNDAILRQREISATDLERLIKANVVLLYHSIQETMARLEQERTAVRNYQDSIQAELERLRAGEASLVDAIFTEQQQTGSLLSLLEAQRRLASDIAELNFQTGALVRHTDGESRVNEDSLLRVAPAQGGSARP